MCHDLHIHKVKVIQMLPGRQVQTKSLWNSKKEKDLLNVKIIFVAFCLCWRTGWGTKNTDRETVEWDIPKIHSVKWTPRLTVMMWDMTQFTGKAVQPRDAMFDRWNKSASKNIHLFYTSKNVQNMQLTPKVCVTSWVWISVSDLKWGRNRNLVFYLIHLW